MGRRALGVIAGVLACLACAGEAQAANFNVADTDDLAAALNPATGAQDADTITFTADIVLTQDLPAVQRNVTVVGDHHTLSGDNQFRGFFIGRWTAGTATQAPVTVAIQDLTISAARAKGGNGGGRGGGGAGLGGALFVANLAGLDLADVQLSSNDAVGGNGGGFFVFGGGAGGMGGAGGEGTGGGGGGLGAGAHGGDAIFGLPGAGIALGAAPGGGDFGGAAGGGGGSASTGGGGGVGGTNAGVGGFGGGGGAGSAPGNGGFGGGGGGGGDGGGDGGFGGGGGGSQSATPGGTGGFGADNGGGSNGLGGAGAGMGGGIFIQQGGTLTVSGPLTVDGNTVTGGTDTGAGAQAFGSGLFLQGDDTGNGGGGSLTFSPGAGQAQVVSDEIADEVFYGGTGTWGVDKTGAGTLTLSGTNTYAGGTTVSDGLLNADGSIGDVSVTSGGTLGGSGGVGQLTSTAGTISPGDGGPGALQAGNASLDSDTTVAMELNGPNQGSDYDVLNVGNVDLGSANLALTLGFTATPGETFTIVGVNIGDVTGTFAGLPDGAILEVDGQAFRIHYENFPLLGGAVTLTAQTATPGLATAASAGVELGSAIHDTATLTAGAAPTGAISFKLYGPNDSSCTGEPIFTDSQPVSGNDTYESAAFTPAASGTYRWVASYSGDASNDPVSGACNDPGESVTVSPTSTGPGPGVVPPPSNPNCDRRGRLLAKVKRQKRRAKRAHGAHKRRFIKRNIRETRRRLRGLGC